MRRLFLELRRRLYNWWHGPDIPAPVIQKKTRQKRKPDLNLSDLMDQLDSAMENIWKPVEYSMLDKDTRKAMRKHGALVVPRSDAMFNTKSIVPRKQESAFIFVALKDGLEPQDIRCPSYMFAQKLKRPPLGCERIPGIPYECGVAYKFSERLVWYQFVLMLRGDKLVPARVRRPTRIRVNKTTDYVRMDWDAYTFMRHPGLRDTDEQVMEALGSAFMFCFNLWYTQDNEWNVRVTKGERKARFVVPRAHTKWYFADRDKTAVDANGKAKKIVHYCKAHDRRLPNGSVVRVAEHIRGLSEFDWNGAHVHVISPQFQVTAHNFDIGGDDDMPPDAKSITMPKVLDMIGEIEGARRA